MRVKYSIAHGCVDKESEGATAPFEEKVAASGDVTRNTPLYVEVADEKCLDREKNGRQKGVEDRYAKSRC